jgi:hypothetical protein
LPVDKPATTNTKQTSELDANIDKMDLPDIYRVFHPAAAQYAFFSVSHGPLSKTDHILRHKASLSKYEKTENKNYLCPIRQQWNKTRTQQQKKVQKILKHMDTEQHRVEGVVCH